MIAISSVQWSNGFRCDLDALSRLCRDRDVFLIVDAVQQIGAIPLDVQRTPVDALACGGHKWLMSPFGCGFLYLSKEFRAKVKPPLAGYLSVAEPEGGWDTYFETPSIAPVATSNFVRLARRWETGGTANYPGAIGLAESVGLINEIGIENVGRARAARSPTTSSTLSTRQKIDVVTPDERRIAPASSPSPSTSRRQHRADRVSCSSSKVLVSVRYTSDVGGVRVSCHLFNNRDDLDRLVELTA